MRMSHCFLLWCTADVVYVCFALNDAINIKLLTLNILHYSLAVRDPSDRRMRKPFDACRILTKTLCRADTGWDRETRYILVLPQLTHFHVQFPVAEQKFRMESWSVCETCEAHIFSGFHFATRRASGYGGWTALFTIGFRAVHKSLVQSMALWAHHH